MRRSPLLLALLLVVPATTRAQDEVKEKLEKALQVSPNYTAEGQRVSLDYPLHERKELYDFKVKGFDKAEVRKVRKSKAFGQAIGLECGAGARRTGLVMHKLTWRGDFSVKLTLMVVQSAPSAQLCFLLGKKVGVEWGQRIVKPSRFRPYNKRAPAVDRTAYREARRVELKFVRKGQILTVECDGRRTDTWRFKRGELDDIQIGFMARNMRFMILGLAIEGGIDPRKIKIK